ncbi:MAG: 1-(5-phosphoribosyl)-5-[(5-phosphoribosylamino)methylideneamino]imidazole-4-carboxamide isomerase [Bacteroidetes bacterium]|nr:1-(5-phosphoribosyl)-5-[(5-phosphoribosylamino)methylideneamino]imidazole-4-carboxamide isomerase [Bacteroidota bacterium]
MIKDPFQIIPAIDVIGGKCVRLSQGDYNHKTVYDQAPLEVAIELEDNGITRLHLVDLDGAKKGEPVNLKVLETIANKTKLIIDFGGGLKTEENSESAFNAGAAIIVVGSLAVKNPILFLEWLDKYGPAKVLLGADVKEEMIAIAGWTETTQTNVLDFLKTNISKGLTQAFCTDISKDGMLQGPSLELYKKILTASPELNLIASGGVTTITDIYSLQEAGCCGAIIGKALYEKRITFSELKKFVYAN